MQKNVNERAKSLLRFEGDMYTNIYGSVIICAAILSGIDEEKIKMINLLWRRAKKKSSLIDWNLSDEDFIDKTLAFFDVEKPKEFPIAFVQYGTNALFAPYIDGRVFPLREDGLKGAILTKGKVYPIDFRGEEKKENDD